VVINCWSVAFCATNRPPGVSLTLLPWAAGEPGLTDATSNVGVPALILRRTQSSGCRQQNRHHGMTLFHV
jgi:hypothetical protein